MVYFSLRENKKKKKGLSPIEASISYCGERIYFSTSKFVKPSEWNKQKQMVKGNSPEVQLVNNYLIELRNKIYEKEVELMKRGYMGSPDKVRGDGGHEALSCGHGLESQGWYILR